MTIVRLVQRLINGPMKLNIQLPDVANALVGARILRGTISAGYSQVIPSLVEIWSVSPQRCRYMERETYQPTAKKLLNTNRKTACAIPAWVLMLFGSRVT